MDEMNNVTMENETSMMENAPVENLVPAEAENYNLHLEDTIDRSYFDKMATKAIEAISEYGDFEQFASNDSGEPPWQKPDIPWDDVQDEAAQNFDVR